MAQPGALARRLARALIPGVAGTGPSSARSAPPFRRMAPADLLARRRYCFSRARRTMLDTADFARRHFALLRCCFRHSRAARRSGIPPAAAGARRARDMKSPPPSAGLDAFGQRFARCRRCDGRAPRRRRLRYRAPRVGGDVGFRRQAALISRSFLSILYYRASLSFYYFCPIA